MKEELTKNQLFRIACYSDDIQKTYHNWIEKKIVSVDVFGLGLTEYSKDKNIIHIIFKPSKICRHCNKEVSENDFDIAVGYWTPNLWFNCHKNCVKEQKQQEAYECQKIDANCNDCKFFKRGDIKDILTGEHSFLMKSVNFWVTKSNEEMKSSEFNNKFHSKRTAKIGDEVLFNGFCNKKNIPSYAFSHFSTGYECFEHRKDL